MAWSVDIEETKPRIAGRQCQRPNIHTQSCADYCHLNLIHLWITYSTSTFPTQFDIESLKLVAEVMNLLPSSVSSQEYPVDRETVQSLLEFYKDYLPCSISFKSKLDVWKSKWKGEPPLACTLNAPGKALHYANN